MNDIKELRELAGDLTLLYVEDEVELRTAVVGYLRKIFDRVDIAEDGQSGLKKFQEHQYDIVITDILMPYMNGLEMAAEIKQIDPEQEIVIASAYSEPIYFLDAIRLGISGYIIKPIDYEQMNMTLYKSTLRLTRFHENIRYKEHLEELVEQRTLEKLQLEYDQVDNFEHTLTSLVALIEQRDTYTGGHSQRVADYSKLIAEEMGRSPEECTLLYRAGILHDIGKVATPDTVLLKPGKLTKLEFNLIKEHVTVGYDMLQKIPMYRSMAEIIRHHHERFDGTGYPDGLKGNEIPVLAQVMIVADAFDAMTTNRIYKGRKSVEGAFTELRSYSGTQFHPPVVDAAMRVLGKVDITTNTSQLPTTEIEKERFSYFYRDQVTEAYNQSYLDFILNRNFYEKEYSSLCILYLHNFNSYNQSHSWAEGDRLLEDFVEYLLETYPKILVFRIHGDDFVLMAEEKIEIDLNGFASLEMLNTHDIRVSKLYVDLSEGSVHSFAELEQKI